MKFQMKIIVATGILFILLIPALFFIYDSPGKPDGFTVGFSEGFSIREANCYDICSIEIVADVEMEVVNIGRSGRSILLKVTNNTNYEYLYGAPNLLLETSHRGEWIPVEFLSSRDAFLAIGHVLEPKSCV